MRVGSKHREILVPSGEAYGQTKYTSASGCVFQYVQRGTKLSAVVEMLSQLTVGDSPVHAQAPPLDFENCLVLQVYHPEEGCYDFAGKTIEDMKHPQFFDPHNPDAKTISIVVSKFKVPPHTHTHTHTQP